jgi:hypothetical protein
MAGRVLTVLIFASKEDSDDGRFTKQFLRCTRDISAEVAWLFRRLDSGAILANVNYKGSKSLRVMKL